MPPAVVHGFEPGLPSLSYLALRDSTDRFARRLLAVGLPASGMESTRFEQPVVHDIDPAHRRIAERARPGEEQLSASGTVDVDDAHLAADRSAQ